MDRSTISEIAERLEKRGLLRKMPDQQDERASKLYLTEQGEREIEEALPGIIEVNRNLLTRLPEHLHAPFIEALKILANSEA